MTQEPAMDGGQSFCQGNSVSRHAETVFEGKKIVPE